MRRGDRGRARGLEDKKRALTRDEKASGLLGYVFRLRKGLHTRLLFFM